MTIEIRMPEREALIQQRMASGAFQSVEDVLMEALKSWPVPRLVERNSGSVQPKQNFADFLMESPLRDSGLVLERVKDYPLPVDRYDAANVGQFDCGDRH